LVSQFGAFGLGKPFQTGTFGRLLGRIGTIVQGGLAFRKERKGFIGGHSRREDLGNQLLEETNWDFPFLKEGGIKF